MFVDFSTCFTNPKQFIRLIVLLSCVAVTIYQLKGCIEKIVHPPISTSNKLILNDSIRFPSITICRKPAFKTNLFPNYGLKRRTEITNKGAFKDFPFGNVSLDKFMEETTYSLQETIYMYGYDGIVFNEVFNITERYFMELGRCYTFQTNQFATKLTIDGGIFFYFDSNKMNTSHMLPDMKHSEEGFYIFIHDAMEVIADLKYQKKTYSQSIFLEVGELLYAALDIKVFHTVDRSQDHCESNESYSQSKCIRNCLHSKIMEEFNCSLPWLSGDKVYPRCNNSEVIDGITSTMNNKRTEYISTCNCPVSCHLFFYCQKIVQRKPYEYRKRSLLSLYYDSSIVTVVQEAVSYNWYSLIADLGGSLGLFLGLSVIGFIEIIEAGFSFLFEKRRQKLDREEYITSLKDQRIIGTLIRNFASRNCTEDKKVISK